MKRASTLVGVGSIQQGDRDFFELRVRYGVGRMGNSELVFLGHSHTLL